MWNDNVQLHCDASDDLSQIINELNYIERMCKRIQEASNRLEKYKLPKDMHDHLNRATAFNKKACRLIADHNRETIIELDAHKLWIDHAESSQRQPPPFTCAAPQRGYTRRIWYDDMM